MLQPVALRVLKDFMSMMTIAKERVGVVLHRDGGSHWHIGSSRKEEPLRLAAELLVDSAKVIGADGQKL